MLFITLETAPFLVLSLSLLSSNIRSTLLRPWGGTGANLAKQVRGGESQRLSCVLCRCFLCFPFLIQTVVADVHADVGTDHQEVENVENQHVPL